MRPDRPPVFHVARAGAPSRPRDVARGDHGPDEERTLSGVRPFDRCPYIAHPGGDRERSEEDAPHHHRARQRLRVRQEPGMTMAYEPSLSENLSEDLR